MVYYCNLFLASNSTALTFSPFHSCPVKLQPNHWLSVVLELLNVSKKIYIWADWSIFKFMATNLKKSTQHCLEILLYFSSKFLPHCPWILYSSFCCSTQHRPLPCSAPYKSVDFTAKTKVIRQEPHYWFTGPSTNISIPELILLCFCSYNGGSNFHASLECRREC